MFLAPKYPPLQLPRNHQELPAETIKQLAGFHLIIYADDAPIAVLQIHV